MKKILNNIISLLVSLSVLSSVTACGTTEFSDSLSGGSSQESSWNGSESLSDSSSSGNGSSSDETPDSSLPTDSSSKDETPDSSLPADSSSKDETPDGSSPTDSSSSDTTPDNSSEDSTPDDSSSEDSTPEDSTPDDSSSGGVTPPVDPTPDDEETYADFSVHFLELGNKYTGDCTYIKAGDTDILIDAGSRKDSASTIHNYIKKYCTDGVLEYVITTHAHQDHIAGFVGNGSQGIFDLYKVGTLFDFPRANSTSQIYSNYKTKRDNLIKNGTKHYTALQWWKEEKGLTQSIEIADGITMNVLYQKYYESSTSNENDNSVCVMFSRGDDHYLFTGDLENAGETSLAQSNDLPKVKLYKAGHHGSKTSSNTILMQEIQPEIVCVCCCAGSSEYNAAPLNTFPTQDFINRVAPYTDKIYVTSLSVNYANDQTVSMNGNIVVSAKGNSVTVNCSNNNTILKETEWFKANRTWPSNGV